MFWNKKSEYEELYDKIDKLQKELKNTQDSILKIVNIMKNYDFNKRITYESGIEDNSYVSYTSIFINLKCYKFCNLRLYNPVFREHKDNKNLLTIFDTYEKFGVLYTYEYLVDLNQGTFITVSEKKDI
jgi:hypothetical protein